MLFGEFYFAANFSFFSKKSIYQFSLRRLVSEKFLRRVFPPKIYFLLCPISHLRFLGKFLFVTGLYFLLSFVSMKNVFQNFPALECFFGISFTFTILFSNSLYFFFRQNNFSERHEIACCRFGMQNNNVVLFFFDRTSQSDRGRKTFSRSLPLPLVSVFRTGRRKILRRCTTDARLCVSDPKRAFGERKKTTKHEHMNGSGV